MTFNISYAHSRVKRSQVYYICMHDSACSTFCNRWTAGEVEILRFIFDQASTDTCTSCTGGAGNSTLHVRSPHTMCDDIYVSFQVD